MTTRRQRQLRSADDHRTPVPRSTTTTNPRPGAPGTVTPAGVRSRYVGLRIAPAMWERFKAAARDREDVPASTVLRRLIAEYLDTPQP